MRLEGFLDDLFCTLDLFSYMYVDHMITLTSNRASFVFTWNAFVDGI